MTIEQLKIEMELCSDSCEKILNENAAIIRCNILDPDNSNYEYFFGYFFVDSNDGHCYLFNDDYEPDDMSKIKFLDEMFIFRDIERIVIPNSVTKIENCTFYCCNHLDSVIIPDSVTSIGKYAFSNCVSLKNILIPESVKIIDYYAFVNCASLAEITIPKSVEEIGFNAFKDCISLKSLVFKGKTRDEVRKMDNYPFGIGKWTKIKCI